MVGDAERLYTRRAGVYPVYVQAFGHRQSLQAVLSSVVCLHGGERILDAGCGTGLSTLAIAAAFQAAGKPYAAIDAFDLTPAMLDAYHETVTRARLRDVQAVRADVLALDDQLPDTWSGYELVVCSSMLEYVPRESLAAALAALRARLRQRGQLVVLLTRKSFYLTRWLWRCEGYTRTQISNALRNAGFAGAGFRHYPWPYVWMNLGNHLVVATNQDAARSPASPS